MRWGKIVLLFQAVVTLILGMVFLSQVLVIDTQKIIQDKITQDTPLQEQMDEDISNIKSRFSTAAYILLFVSLIELIIIIRLVS